MSFNAKRAVDAIFLIWFIKKKTNKFGLINLE